MILLNFEKEYILENKVVRLSPLKVGDFNKLLPFSINEPELWIHSLISANGQKNLKNYIDFALEGRNNQTAYPFIIFDKRTNEYAGSTRFYDFQSQHQTTQLGYTWYGKKFQRTGLNRNCKYLLLEFAFETLGLERVEFRADANNSQSITAMKNLGCTVEGILRSNCASPDGRRNSIVLSILKEEWFQEVKPNLLKKL